MYSKEHIIATCKECGINSIASDLLMQALMGDLSGVKQIMPVILEVITRDGIEFHRIKQSPYYASKCGLIYSSKRRRILKQYIHGDYLAFTISGFTVYKNNGGNSKHAKVHKVIAEQFVPNPENKPYVNHIDSNKVNNDASNLEWVTHLENIKHYNQYCIRTTGKSNATAILTKDNMLAIIELREKGVSCKEVGRIYCVSEHTITLAYKRMGVQHLPFY